MGHISIAKKFRSYPGGLRGGKKGKLTKQNFIVIILIKKNGMETGAKPFKALEDIRKKFDQPTRMTGRAA